MANHEAAAREIVKVCIGNADEPEVALVMAILQRRYGAGTERHAGNGGENNTKYRCPECGLNASSREGELCPDCARIEAGEEVSVW